MSSDPLTTKLRPYQTSAQLFHFRAHHTTRIAKTLRQVPTAAAFRSFVFQCCCELWFGHLHRLAPSSPFRFDRQNSSGRGGILGKHVGVLSDLLAFDFGHGDRHAQVLC